MVAECNYKELDHQLKEQFIHDLNNTTMLDKEIRELTTKGSNDQTTSEDVLIWAKTVEAQRMQAVRLSDITDSQRFNQAKVAKHQAGQRVTYRASSHQLCRYCGSVHAPRQCLAYGKTCTSWSKVGHFKKVWQSRKDHTVHEVAVEVSQEDDKIEKVSINSVYLNNKWSLITTNLEMQFSENTVKIPYKIDTGSEGNLMPLYIFKKLCGHQCIEQLKRFIKNNIKLQTYNGMQIELLGMCTAIIKFKNF